MNITAEQFKTILNSEVYLQDTELLELQKQYTVEQTKNSALRVAKEHSFSKHTLKMQIDESFFNCKECFRIEMFSDSLDFIKQSLEICKRLDDTIKKDRETLDENRKIIFKAIPQLVSRFNYDYLLLVESIEIQLELYKKYSKTDVVDRLGKLIETVVDIKSKIDEDINGLTYFINKLSIELNNKKNSYEAVGKEVDDAVKSVREINVKLKQLKKMDVFFKTIYLLFEEDNMDILAHHLVSQCSNLLDRINNLAQLEQSAPKIAALKELIKTSQERITRINNFTNRLNELEPSAKYALMFIEKNIEHISDIFLSLHMPKEFTRLELKDKRIVGIRNDVPVKITQMSTGQRVAVLLSIFLKLNSMMETAPQFILFDEPVSNIDDLNIISLIDFLREMYLTNDKQIFITTANNNVRRLIRRKFSFLEKDFIELSFDRHNDLNTTIKPKQYTQTGTIDLDSINFQI